MVFGLIAWKGLPAIKAGMNARTERIQGDLDAAESQRTEADTLLVEYRAQLAEVQAIADLRGEVANLAIGAAEQVVERSLDRDTNVALVESFINQVGANS